MSTEVEMGNWEPSKAKPNVTFSEMADQEYDRYNKAEKLSAYTEGVIGAYDRRNDDVLKATGEKLFNPLRDIPDNDSLAEMQAAYREHVGAGNVDKSRAVFQQEWFASEYDRRLREIQDRYPQHGGVIKSDRSPVLDHAEIAQAAERKSADIAERLGMVDVRDGRPGLKYVPVLPDIANLVANTATNPTATVAQFWGGFKAQMQDPVEATMNLLGFGAGKASMSVLKTALLNAGANAAIEAAAQPMRQYNRKELGLEYGWERALADISGAAATGALLDAGVRIPYRAAVTRFGKDAPAGEMFSKHGRGGILTDAIEQTTPITPIVREQITPAELEKARAGDIDAIEAIAKKTGAIDDLGVKGALDYAKLGGKIDDAMVERFKAMGVDHGEMMATLKAAIDIGGNGYVRVPDPIPQAKAPLDTAGAAELATRLQEIEQRLAEAPQEVRQAVLSGVATGIPEIVQAARAALSGDLEGMRKAVADAGGEQIVADRVTVHTSTNPIAVARALRRSPDVMDSTVPMRSDFMRMARAISKLDDAAFEMLLRGEAHPMAGHIVADNVPPGQHAEVLRQVSKFRDIDDARAAVPDLVREPSQVSEPDAGIRVSDPSGPEAKAQVDALEKAHAKEVEAATAPAKRREELEAQIEKLRGEIARGETEPEAAKPAKPAEPENTERVTTPDGTRSYPVTFEVVDASTLRAASGELQPRDRSTRAASAVQVQEMAANLNPDLLTRSALSDRGAPIVDETGTVLSGNGRMSVITLASQSKSPGYDAYLKMLRDEGYKIDGMKQPVLVRRLIGLDQEAKRDFAVRSNYDDKLGMSASELARVDRDLISDDALALLDPDGEAGIASAANRPFVRAIMSKMSAAQRGGLVGESGEITPSGVTRIEGAIFAKAYGDKSLVNKIVEDQEGAGIRNALLSAAPAWAQMRSVASPEYDITPNLVEAVGAVAKMRAERVKPNEYFAQQDAFATRSPLNESLAKLFYNESGSRAAAWRRTRDDIKAYARIAMDRANAVADLMGEKLTPLDIIGGQLRARVDDQPAMFAIREGGIDGVTDSKSLAKAGGFDTSMVLYHGTGDQIDAFSLRKAQDKEGRQRGLGLGKGKIYLTGNKWSAGQWALQAPERGLGKKPNVIPVYVKGNLLDEKVYQAKFKELSGGRDLWDSTLEMKERDGFIAQTDKWAQSEGYAGIRQAWTDQATGEILEVGQVAMFKPQNIRSVNAAFDPSKSDSPNLMFALKDGEPTLSKQAELRKLERELEALQAEQAVTLNDPALYRMVMDRAAVQRRLDIRRAIDDALRLGDRMLPEGTKVDIRTDEMRDPATGSLLDASSDMTTGDVALASYALNPAGRMGHEAVHTLVTRGHISPEEITLLAQMARERGLFSSEARYRDAYAGRDNLDALINEEAAAHAIEARINGTDIGPANTMADRIKQIIERIRNALDGYGFKTADDVARAIINGEAAQRTASVEWMRNADIAAASVKDGKVYAFGGERAKTADLDALSRAKSMADAGDDRTKIWTDTGWFKGVDGKWRFEIDDSSAVLNDTGKRRNALAEAVSHKEFFDAYPMYNDRDGFNLSTKMHYLAPTSRILGGGEAIWRGFWDGVGVRDDLSPIETLSGTLHEMQHAAQDVEEFAKGSSFSRKDPDAYWRSGGEVEARAVETRMDLTPSERRARPPWLDYDVEESQQIVRMFALADADTGRSMRADLDALGYYSKALEAAKAMKQAKGTPEQMLVNIRSVNADFDPAKSSSPNLLAALRDAPPIDPLKTDMAIVDRMNTLKELIEACR